MLIEPAPAPATRRSPRAPVPEEPAPAVDDSVKKRILALVPRKPAIRSTCSTWIWISKPILGVDTVKQAEVFASGPRSYGIARDDKLKLRDFPRWRT